MPFHPGVPRSRREPGANGYFNAGSVFTSSKKVPFHGASSAVGDLTIRVFVSAPQVYPHPRLYTVTGSDVRPKVAAGVLYSRWNSAADNVRGVYVGDPHRSPPNRASSGAKLAETPTQASACTDDAADRPGDEYDSMRQVPKSGTFGAEAHAARSPSRVSAAAVLNVDMSGPILLG